MKLNKELVVVRSASLGLYNRGVLTINLDGEYELGGCQNLCGVVIDDFDKEKDRRVGTAAGCELIRQLLMFFGVDDLSEVKNHICYVLFEGEGLAIKPRGLENINFEMNNGRPKRIIYQDILDEFKPA